MRGVIDRRLAAISSVVVLGAIMSILDTTIVNVAIRALSEDFHSPLSTIQWVSTGYMLALATVIPLTGWASERFGTKRLFMSSVALFMLGSALCGLAWSDSSLIAFRVLQGFGGGMLMPVGMTILTQAAGPQRVGRVMSIIGVPMLLAPIVGPVLGGWLVDTSSWRWIFYVNVPVGVIALALAWKILDRDEPVPHHRLDVLGLLLLSPGLALVVYGLAEIAAEGSLQSPRAISSLAGGAVLVTLEVLHMLSDSQPLLDLTLFRERAFSAAALTVTLLGGALFGAMILIPLYFQTVRDASALEAGLLMAPQGLGAALAMPLSGWATDKYGAGRVVVPGIVVGLLGTVAFTQLTADTPYWLLSGSLVVRGVGLGMTMMPAMSAAYQTLQRSAIPRATTTLNILNRVGGAAGTAVLAVVLQDAIPTPATPELVAEAFGTTFWWALALTALSMAPALLLPRTRAQRSPQASAEAAAEVA